MFKFRQSEEELIEEMHNEFETAPDRLLQQALNIMNIAEGEKVSTEEEILTKARKLYKLGFVNTELVNKMTEITKRNKTQDRIIKKELELAKTIKKYSEIYPKCKFLTIEELNRICKKYGLVYAQVQHYTKTVPDENLKEIEENNPYLGDWAKPLVTHHVHWTLKNKTSDGFLTSSDTKDWANPIIVEHEQERRYDSWDVERLLRQTYRPDKMLEVKSDKCHVDIVDKSGLFIAAPKKHFNTDNLSFDGAHGLFSLKRKKVIKTDPVVFKFVKDGVLIITKWGLVGDDPLLKS